MLKTFTKLLGSKTARVKRSFKCVVIRWKYMNHSRLLPLVNTLRKYTFRRGDVVNYTRNLLGLEGV